MSRIAILIGNTTYQNLPTLSRCNADVAAMRNLLEATEKYHAFEVIENASAEDLKTRIRSALADGKATDEAFFYFSGHGYQNESDFYFCSANFDSRRPNETGLSNEDLHDLLRLANSELIVKVIDACNSGTLLVKDARAFSEQSKEGLNNLVQIASCLESQNALTGNPISKFTASFRDAALRKSEGPVFYTDIIAVLRDEYLGNAAQTPHFVSQFTARELFVDDATKLRGHRGKLDAQVEQTQALVGELSYSSGIVRNRYSLLSYIQIQRNF